MFVTRFNAQGSALVWSTFLGGQGDNVPSGMAVTDTGEVVVAGGAGSGSSLPTTPGAYQEVKGNSVNGFVVRLNATGQNLVYATYVGGTAFVGGAGVAIDPSGIVTFGGGGSAPAGTHFPMTPGAFDTTGPLGLNMYFIRLSSQGDRAFYSSFLGGPSSEFAGYLAVSPTGRTTIVGACFSPGGWPTTSNALQPNFVGGQSDGVVTTLDLYLEGVESTTESAPGCRGPLTMNATEMPAAGAEEFALYCSAAPPHAEGDLLVREFPVSGFVSIPVGGLTLETRGVVKRISVKANENGYVETPFPLTTRTVGQRIEFRYVFQDPPACPGLSGSGSSSNGLVITVK